ncbi:SAM-dependent methyltransferase [Rheinheimera muenzenbergensis]|uniref:SAM-dependent methyltransferase n=1 Tax=Rheinheimera muenzenbergensis TaxID=1193628 RepID=A0ABU8C5Z3_9GAMM
MIFSQQFKQYSDVLQQYRYYWQFLPFSCEALPWQGTALQQLLSQLTERQLTALEQDAAAQQQLLQPFFPELFQLAKLEQRQDNCAAASLPALPFWLANGIGGRKLEQIDALCQHWPQLPLPVLEWCAGKGHLGRVLAHRFARPVVSVEWQQSLCQQGSELANKLALPQQFICADVLRQPLSGVLQPQQQVVALHACGQLHIRLLQQVVAAGCQQLQLIPCCYHLISSDLYQPLSTLGQQRDLALSKEDLKLVVQGQVTGGDRTERLRHTEVLWRLAYDELRKQLTGQQSYQPLASVAKHWFSGEFFAFAQWAAQQHGLTLPAKFSSEAYLQRAQTRLLLVKQIQLVRHLFRRPLELWLALDKALFLQQHGYSVSLTEFCDYQLTPRNMLLQASKTPTAAGS